MKRNLYSKDISVELHRQQGQGNYSGKAFRREQFLHLQNAAAPFLLVDHNCRYENRSLSRTRNIL